MNSFSVEFIRLFDAAFGKSDKNNRIYGANKMNDLLTEKSINYCIEGKPQKGPWKVCRKRIEIATQEFDKTSANTTHKPIRQNRTENTESTVSELKSLKPIRGVQSEKEIIQNNAEQDKKFVKELHPKLIKFLKQNNRKRILKKPQKNNK